MCFEAHPLHPGYGYAHPGGAGRKPHGGRGLQRFL